MQFHCERVQIAGLSLVALAGVVACERPAELSSDPARPNIVLVTLDTTRPDHLGCYGYARVTSPELDRLCADARVYTRAYSTTSWTLPSHASLFTGALIAAHGATRDENGPLLLSSVLDERAGEGHRVFALDPDMATLSSLLAARGYATGGFVAGPWLKRLFGLAAGFEHWDDEGIEELNGRRAEDVTQAALRWLETIEGRPFLLFLNYYDPHSPYDPPEGWRDAFLAAPPPSGAATTLEQAVALYDGEIRYVDHQLGIVLDRLRQLDAYDDAWIIVTADHGELLGEHGKTGHGRFLYEEEIRIPLIVKPPKGTADYAQARIDTPASLVDIVPMLARALDLEEPPAARASALALGRGAGRRVLAELEPEPHLRVRGNWKALIDGPFKLIWNDAGHTRLHDLRRSGAEDVNLSGREASRLGQLEAELETLLSSLPPPLRARAAGSSAGEVVDEATRRALEGLGYLERDE